VFIGTSILLWFLMLLGLKLMQDLSLITSKLDLFLLATWCGIPLTMFTGLTDSAADSIGVLALGIFFTDKVIFQKIKYKLAIALGVLATLTKESAVVYLLALLIIRMFQLRSASSNIRIKSFFFGLFSFFPILTWQIYIKVNFGIWGFEAGSAISQKIPFGSYFSELTKSGKLLLTGDFNLASLSQLIGLVIYSALLANSLVFLFSNLKNFYEARKSAKFYGVRQTHLTEIGQQSEIQLFSTVFVILVLIVQSTMGLGVLFNWTGYLKNAFPLVLIFCFSSSLKSLSFFKFSLLTRREIRIVMVIASLLCFRWFYVPLPHYTNLGIYPLTTIEKFSVVGQQPCKKVAGQLVVQKMREIQPLARKVTLREPLYQLKIALTNSSPFDWGLSQDPGAFKVGYQWIDRNGLVIRDGQRALLPSPLKVNETLEMALFVPVPSGLDKNSQVSISLIQEGCYWSWSCWRC
jgi:hypothetical protein